jgi:hypothetical protein
MIQQVAVSATNVSRSRTYRFMCNILGLPSLERAP